MNVSIWNWRRLLCGFCVAMAWGFAAECHAQMIFNDADSFQKSLQSESAGDLSTAMDVLRPGLQQFPQDYLLNFRMGYLNLLSKNYQESQAFYRQAIFAEPGSLEARNAILLPYLEQNQFAEAEEIARQTREVVPLDYYANLRLAFALRMQGKFGEAEQIHHTLLQLYPTDIKFLLEHGLTLNGQGRTTEAKVVFERIVHMDPDNQLARQMLEHLSRPEVRDSSTASVGGLSRPVLPDPYGRPQPVATILPYYSYLFYGNGSIKRDGDIYGMYGSLNFTTDLLEFDFAKTFINYRTFPPLDQYDITAIYTNYHVPNWGAKIGAHRIGSNSASNNAWVLIGGLQYYELDCRDFSTDFYFSRYDQLAAPVSVFEVAPKWGRYWWKAGDHSLRTEWIGYGIAYSHNVGIPGTLALSTEGRVSLDRGPWGYTAYGWAGRQAFAVRNGGFLVFNLNEERLGGYGGEVRYSFSQNAKLSGRVGNELLRDSVLGNRTFQLAATAMFSYAF